MHTTIKVKRISEKAHMPMNDPVFQGLIFLSCETHNIAPNAVDCIFTGIHITIPKGYYGVVEPFGTTRDVKVNISTRLYRPGYSGSIHFNLCNLDNNEFCHIRKGEEICILFLRKVESFELEVEQN